MKKIGIIAEYNPFHNGHIYHLEEAKKLYPDASIVLVMSSSFTQRGIPSMLNKWDKTRIALEYGVDLVIELPYSFATQSADIFARGAIEILKECQVDYLVFGSEENDVEKLMKLADIQLNENTYQESVKKYLDQGKNYPTALNLALNEKTNEEIKLPNDLLGLSYVKEIIMQGTNIMPVTIKRTNDYHDTTSNLSIASASSIRERVRNNLDIEGQVPKETAVLLKNGVPFLDEYFKLLKYKIYSCSDLSVFLDVDEGIENRILKVINDVSSFDELVSQIKSKRYTHNKIMRMFNHILCGYTKEENKNYQHVSYLRVLGFSDKGREILKKIKKNTNLPIITKFKKDIPGLQLEKRITSVYASIFDNKKQQEIICEEFQSFPICKKD